MPAKTWGWSVQRGSSLEPGGQCEDFIIVLSIFDDDDDVLIMGRLKYNGDDYFVGDDDHDHLIRDREVVEGEMRRRHCFLSLSGLW